MLVLNLKCGHEHRFEGWFGSAADFETQVDRGLIACPVCEDRQIKRMPTAPHLNVSHLRADPSKPASGEPAQLLTSDAAQELKSKVLTAVAQVLANTEDVGERFAEEARRIHYGETEAHGIRGQASLTELAELIDEGIAVLPLPLPAHLKGRLQ